MDIQTDLLDRVVAELDRRKGDLPKVARETGLSYDTILRIKNRENDPGYSKVRLLADYLLQPELIGQPGAPEVTTAQGA